MDDHSPVETPTTPHSPNFPLFPLDTSFTRRRSSILSTLSISPRRSPTISIPNSPLSSTIAHPLPIRSAKVTKKAHSRSRSPPPTFHLRVQTSTPEAFRHAVAHLETQLVPLISVSNGLPHPEFPLTILQYHLLTHDRLDDLARFYHQVTPPVRETFRYPCLIPAWVSRSGDGDVDMHDETDLETKRRRWGRFIGLRGCDTPVVSDEYRTMQREIEQRMEREWRRGLERERDEARLRDKAWRGR